MNIILDRASPTFKKQIMNSLYKSLRSINSDNIYDIFAKIDEVYQNTKLNKKTGKIHKVMTLNKFFQHIKSAYNMMI
jgi:hypothetical protein